MRTTIIEIKLKNQLNTELAILFLNNIKALIKFTFELVSLQLGIKKKLLAKATYCSSINY
jgi:hypothetical protein